MKIKPFMQLMGAVVGLMWCVGGAYGGSFTDSRDGKKYHTVKIGNLTWMAENLNHATDCSWCYENNESNCQKYGRFYVWNTAMVVCPTGWRLPTREDWNNLVEAAGGGDIAGTRLKSTTGWESRDEVLILGTDDFGFLALPGGTRWSGGSFYYVGVSGSWWNATENYGGAWSRFILSNSEKVFESSIHKGNGLSVRCVQ